MKLVFTVTAIIAMNLFTAGLLPQGAWAADPYAASPYPYSKPYVGELKVHRAAYEDTMVNLARDNNLGFVELRAANPYVDPWMPGEGTEIILPTRHLLPKAKPEGIIINLPEMRLYAFTEDSARPVTYPIGVGRVGLSTPLGETTVVRKKIGPTWRPTPRMREEKPDLPAAVTPGMDNPMGTHALYLGWPAYAIHGTNKPFGVGRRVSSGCVRLYPEDIVKLFDMVPVGMKVTVIDQPIKAAWIDDKLYVEAHTSLAQADKMEQHGGVPDYELSNGDLRIIMDEAGPYASAIDWSVLRRVIRERAGYPVAVATRPQQQAAR